MKSVRKESEHVQNGFEKIFSLLLVSFFCVQTVVSQQTTVCEEADTCPAGLLPTDLWQLVDSTGHTVVAVTAELPGEDAPESFRRLIKGKFGVAAAGMLRQWKEDSENVCDTVRISDRASFVAFFDAVAGEVDAEVRTVAEMMTFANLAEGVAKLDYRPTAKWPEMVTFTTNAYHYHPGAAHGMEVSYAETYDVRTHEIFSLAHFSDTLGLKHLIYERLSDYFQIPAGQALFDPVDPDSSDFGRVFPFPEASPSLTAEGVKFIYQRYEIAPGAAGIPVAVVPYADALRFASPEGKRWLERAMCVPKEEN